MNRVTHGADEKLIAFNVNRVAHGADEKLIAQCEQSYSWCTQTVTSSMWTELLMVQMKSESLNVNRVAHSEDEKLIAQCEQSYSQCI